MASEAIESGRGVGTVLNQRWRLHRLLGEGGLASVYEAEEPGGQKRAIKLLHAQFHGQQSVVERFYAEAKACYELCHPNIARVEEYAYADDGSPYMVMELLVGESLEAYLGSHSAMAPKEAARLLIGVLSALGTAHAAGVVHRDLKPPNLFLVSGQDGTSMKVLDFGIAKVMDLAGGMGNKTQAGALLGTPGYMSPEQIKDAKGCDARSDLWSAGIVFFEMLTLRHPYGDDPLGRMTAILRDPPRPVHDGAADLEPWDAFFQRALARDPAARFQSAHEMAVEVAKIAGLPEPAPSPSPGAAALSALSPSHGKAGSSTLSSEDERPGASPTQMSGLGKNAGPSAYPPRIEVETAAEMEPPSVVWWGVLLIGLGSFASGVLVGYLLGAW